MKVPDLGKNIPRRGNYFSRTVGQLILKLLGWRFEEHDPPDLPKFILVVAPHTSNWDGLVGFPAVFAMGLRVHWMGKHTLFKGMFRRFMIWLGGIPIVRHEKHGVVDQIVEQFRRREKFILAITPEGTRKKVTKWKTGFYFISQKARVPMVLAYLDYGRKVCGFGPTIEPSGDLAQDMQTIYDFFSTVTAKHPEQFGFEPFTETQN